MSDVRQSRRLGAIGSIVGLLALLVSSLTYLLPADFFAGPVVSRPTVETGQKLRDHLTFRPKGVEFTSRAASEPRTAAEVWNERITTTAVALGLLAIVFAVVSVILREEKLLAGIAAVLGITAIGVQLFWVMVALFLVMAVASALLS